MRVHSTTVTSGVYRIANVQTGECYIGSSRNVAYRITRHRTYLRAGTHPNTRLQQAWALWGEAAFVFVVVELVDTEDAIALFEVEQGYLDREHPAYNRSALAHGGPRIRVHTAETRAKISAKVKGKAHSEEHNRKLKIHLQAVRPVPSPEAARRMSIANIGTKRSPEFCAGVSERNRGRVLSAETRAKIGAGNKGKSHPVSADARARIGAAKSEWWRQRKLAMET